MKLSKVHQATASMTRAGAPGIKPRAMAQSFAPAGASLGLGKSPAPSRHI